MKLTRYKIFSFMLAAVFALTLAGCGGGGGGTADTTDPPVTTPELTPEEMCAADGGRFEDDETCTSAVDLETERIAAEEAVADKVADDTKSAGTKVTAIEAEAATEGAAGIGGATETDLAIAHKDGAVSISVSRGEDDDKVDFVKMANLTGADDSTGSMNVLGPNDDDETEIAIVYTDIDAPEATKFGAEGTDVMLDANPKTTGENDFQSVEIDADNLAKIKTDGISSTGSGTITVPAAVEDNANTMDDETVAAFETAATFDGAPGTLKCAGASPCMVTLDGDGEITTVGNGWEFTPADGATIDVDDGDYLWYGVWLMKTAQDDGSDEYNQVETFADSSLVEATNVGNVDGSAEYKGGAAGVYVRNVYVPSTTGEQKLDYANSGHFTAVVDLKVYFGQVEDANNLGTIAPNLLNTVSGTIDGFTLSGGEDASGWGVDVAAGINGADLENGTAKGGGGDDGSISGNFRGTDTDDDGAIAPKALVGEFNAEFTNGSVAGGYGARRQ